MKAQRLVHTDSLIKALDDLHLNVSETTTRKRQQALESHNKRTGVRKVNFDVGDYVLVADSEGKSGNKLKV